MLSYRYHIVSHEVPRLVYSGGWKIFVDSSDLQGCMTDGWIRGSPVASCGIMAII